MTAWLLAWLWQGTALAVVLSILLHLLPRVNASTRCLIWWGAFAALIWLGWQSLPNMATGALLSPPTLAATSDQFVVVQVRPLPAWALTLIFSAWISIALFRLLRILPGVHFLYRLKDECRPFPRAVEDKLPLWSEARGRHGRLMVCDRLPGAAVLGLHEPYIAIPSSLVRVLSAHDLDQIILHEYGHVQRRDDWTRLLQALVESALWIHPAAFLIGRELNLEREVACDDRVIARTGSPRDYAACLSRAAESRGRGARPSFAPALFAGRRSLVRRVDRLLNPRRNTVHTPSMLAVTAGMAVIAGCAVHLSAFPLVAESERAIVRVTLDGTEIVRLKPDATKMIRLKPDTTKIIRLKPDATNMIRLKPDTAAKNVAAKNVAVVSGFSRTLMPVASGFSRTVSEPANSLGPSVDVPTLAGTRAVQGAYPPVEVLKNESVDPSPWQAAGNAGAGIGSAAKKASVALASSFTRAGVSIGHSF